MIEYQFKTRIVSEENMIAYIEDGNGKQLATIFPHSPKHTDRKVVIGIINKALSLLNQYLLDETNQEYAEPNDDRPKFTRCVFCGCPDIDHVSANRCELAR